MMMHRAYERVVHTRVEVDEALELAESVGLQGFERDQFARVVLDSHAAGMGSLGRCAAALAACMAAFV